MTSPSQRCRDARSVHGSPKGQGGLYAQGQGNSGSPMFLVPGVLRPGCFTPRLDIERNFPPRMPRNAHHAVDRARVSNDTADALADGAATAVIGPSEFSTGPTKSQEDCRVPQA